MTTAEDKTRRATNYQNAVRLVQAGVAIFPTVNKVPMVRAFTRLDDDLSTDEKEAIRKDALQKHGATPIHIGATRRLSTVRKLWHKFPDATPSIAPGPNGLIVVDPDRKNNGPAKFAAFCKEHGGLPESAVCIPTQDGGQHWYFRDTEGRGNHAGELKSLGCDVRGRGGQVVAPGSIREDGKTYGDANDLTRFLRAFKSDSLPELPGFIRDAIGQPSTANVSDNDPTIKTAIERLNAEPWPEFSDVFDSTVGLYDLDVVRANDDGFGPLYDTPSGDHSTDRMEMAYKLLRQWPDMSPEHLAVFYESWNGAGTLTDDGKGAGNYRLRDIAREWFKNKQLVTTQGYTETYTPSSGEAFEAVDDDEAPDAAKSKTKTAKTLPFEMESDVAGNATLPDWLVQEVVESESLCVVYGAPNSGKSLAVLDLLYHVAAGKPWRGRDVKRGSVLYISVEGPSGTARRAKAWRTHHGIADGESLPLAFIRVDVDLFGDKKSAEAIVNAVALLESMTGLPCRAVAIDTVNAVTPGMDENSSADVGVFLRNLRTILANTRATVLPVHHTGKDESRGLRGSNALLARAETTLLVSDGVLTTVKMRDGERGQKFPFQIKILNLWTDENGKPVGAPVAVEMERGTAMGAVDDDGDDATLTPPDTPADKLRAALRALESCITEQAAMTGDAVSEVGATRSQVFAVMNRDRKAAGLDVLKDPTTVTRLLDKLVESEQARRLGANRRTEYRLKD